MSFFSRLTANPYFLSPLGQVVKSRHRHVQASFYCTGNVIRQDRLTIWKWSIKTSYTNKYLLNHHYISNELFNESATVEEASSIIRCRNCYSLSASTWVHLLSQRQQTASWNCIPNELSVQNVKEPQTKKELEMSYSVTQWWMVIQCILTGSNHFVCWKYIKGP